MELNLDETQKEAIELCSDTKRRIVAITGQAGTGKTTIMKTVYDDLTARGLRVTLCAPTGKAAKRIQEATGIPASTIHRLLEYPHPGEVDAKTGKPLRTTDPKRDRFNPLEYSVVLADEYAMVNEEVHRNLLDALPRAGCIRMFGDVNQLPPIEPQHRRDKIDKSPFEDMLERFPSVRLTTIHRQTGDSSIVSNGDRILKGFIPNKRDDFLIKVTDEPVSVVREFVQTSGIDWTTTENQIISPTKKGWTGTVSLNAMLQGLVHPALKPYHILDRHPWAKEEEARLYVGDKVIFTVNNYDLAIFNGESGIVKEITPHGEVVVDFGDRQVSIPPLLSVMNSRGQMFNINPQRDLDLAYVITTHKAQGSEYQHVTYVLNKGSQFIQSKKNFYTAITRARRSVCVITDSKSLSYSVWKSDSKPPRKSITQKRAADPIEIVGGR